jgi:sporulation protein YlmC with PRC-barrel domain
MKIFASMTAAGSGAQTGSRPGAAVRTLGCRGFVEHVATGSTFHELIGTKTAGAKAQEVPMQTEKIKKSDPESKYRRVLSASTLEGDSVRNSAGEDLGKVDEIMIDIPTGRIAYAVISFGGILRMGNKLFAIPWSSLKLDEDEKCFILDVDRERLETAPGFDKDNWPDLADPNFRSGFTPYGAVPYGAVPYWLDR